MSHTVTDTSIITKAIGRAVKDELARIIDEETADAIKRVRERMAGATDQLALKLLLLYSVERRGMDLIITVKKERPNEVS